MIIEDSNLVMSIEQIKDWLIDAYKTKSWSQINKLIVMFGGNWIESNNKNNIPPPPSNSKYRHI